MYPFETQYLQEHIIIFFTRILLPVQLHQPGRG